MRVLRALLACLFLAGASPTWAAWAFQTAGSVISDSDVRVVGTGITVTNPSGLTSGDNVILYCAFRDGATSTWDTPSGWTVLKTQGSSGNAESVAWARTADTTLVTVGSQNVTGSASGNARCFMLRFTGGPASDYSTGVVSAGISNSTGVADIPTPSRTISTDNTLVLFFAIDNGNRAAAGVVSYPASATSQVASASSFGSNEFSLYGGYVIQTTATNVSSGSIDLTSAGTAISLSMVISIPQAAASVTFTSAPAIGTRTTSSIPIDFTSDTTGTVYGARLTDGSGTPTCDQLEAQTATGGVQYWSEAVTATVADAHTFSSITDGTVTDGYFCIEDGSGNDSAVAPIANMYKLPAFTSGPTFSSCSATGCTYSLTLDGAGTVYGVACKADLTAATVTQVEAAQCTGDAAATASANKAVTGADTLVIGSALDFPIHDFAIVATYGSQHEAAIHADNARLKTAPTGTSYQVLTSVDSQSWYAGISSPSVVATDIGELSNPTDILAQTVTALADGNWSFNNSGARDRICDRIYDRSAQGFMSITDPSASCSGTRAAIWFNNFAPVFSPNNGTDVFKTGVAYSQDICARSTDAEGDALTFALTTGTLTTGLTLGGTGNCTLSGTVANGDEDEDGNTVVFTETDIAGDTATYTLTLYPINTITLPTCIGEVAGDYQSALTSVFIDSQITSVAFSQSVAAGRIISCSPTAGNEVDPFTDTVDLVMSLGLPGTGVKRPQIRMGIGLP